MLTWWSPGQECVGGAPWARLCRPRSGRGTHHAPTTPRGCIFGRRTLLIACRHTFVSQVMGKWAHCDAHHHRSDRGEVTAIVYDGGQVVSVNQTRYGHPGTERGLVVTDKKFTIEIHQRLRRNRRPDDLLPNQGAFTVSLVAQRYMAAEESRVDMAARLVHHSSSQNYIDPPKSRRDVNRKRKANPYSI